MERDPHLGGQLQLLGEDGALLCFRCPPTEYSWLIRTMLGLGPDAEVLAPDALRSLVRRAALDITDRHA
jgi:predicted DNA-binding transcriptional regulator YafY